MRDISGISQSMVRQFLLVCGVDGSLGNFLAGAVVGRDERRVLTIVAGSLALVLAPLPLIGTSPSGGIVLLVG